MDFAAFLDFFALPKNLPMALPTLLTALPTFLLPEDLLAEDFLLPEDLLAEDFLLPEDLLAEDFLLPDELLADDLLGDAFLLGGSLPHVGAGPAATIGFAAGADVRAGAGVTGAAEAEVALTKARANQSNAAHTTSPAG